MDTANGSFTACFLGIGNKGQNIGKKLDTEFKSLIRYYQEHQNDEQFTESEEIPQLTVLSLKNNLDETIKILPQQDVIFLFGSQNDKLFWEIRDAIINLKKTDVLFSLVLSSPESFKGYIYEDQEELLIYFDHESEKQIVTFVKDMCRHLMFPRLISIVCCAWKIVPNNNVKIFTYEILRDDIESFKQFLADHGDAIKSATGLFFLISSNLVSFSVYEINEYFSAIKNAVNEDCNWGGYDSLYVDEGTDYAIKVTIICGERKVKKQARRLTQRY